MTRPSQFMSRFREAIQGWRSRSPGVGLCHLGQPSEYEVELNSNRMLEPQRAGGVENGNAFLERHGVGHCLLDKLDDGRLRSAFVPAGKQVASGHGGTKPSSAKPVSFVMRMSSPSTSLSCPAP